MLHWQEEIKQIEEEIRELEWKLDEPHFTKSPEEGYAIKGKILEKQSQIISIYIREARKIIEQREL